MIKLSKEKHTEELLAQQVNVFVNVYIKYKQIYYIPHLPFFAIANLYLSAELVEERLSFMDNLFYDGFNSKLIETAMFESILEIPVLTAPERIIIPTRAVPFSKRYQINSDTDMLVFYEQDPIFRDFISRPQNFDEELSRVKIFSTPDCSVYRDMPLWEQLANIGVARSMGYYEQQQGKYVIPNVRWGDERTYTNILFDVPPTFAGVPKNSIISIGSYGCCKKKEDKYHLQAFLESMLDYLSPSDVVVYGAFHERYLDAYGKYTNFHVLPDWTSLVRGDDDGN